MILPSSPSKKPTRPPVKIPFPPCRFHADRFEFRPVALDISETESMDVFDLVYDGVTLSTRSTLEHAKGYARLLDFISLRRLEAWEEEFGELVTSGRENIDWMTEQ